MPRHLLGLAMALALSVVSVVSSPADAQRGGDAPTIRAVTAQLYYEETGSLSRDVLAPPSFALWNTIIGEGDAEHASHATLIRAEVSGRNVAVGAVRVLIVATDTNGRVVGRHEATVDLYDGKTRFFAPLFLSETGCEPITISARLLGRGVASTPVVRTIDFRCGE